MLRKLSGMLVGGAHFSRPGDTGIPVDDEVKGK
jgi:hypothetical protein